MLTRSAVSAAGNVAGDGVHQHGAPLRLARAAGEGALAVQPLEHRGQQRAQRLCLEILGGAAGGETVVVPRTNIAVDDQNERRLGVLRGGVTLDELVRGLNSLGVGPRDLITILQTIKAAGALQAELEVR